MGRPPIGKKAMTPAERQRRRRKVLRRERTQAEKLQKQADNAARYAKHTQLDHPIRWVHALPISPPLDDKADELARQLLDIIHLDPDLSLAAVQKSLARLTGMELLKHGEDPERAN